MQANNFLKEKGSNMNNIIALMTRNKMCHLRKKSTTTKILSLPLLVLGNPNTKSIDISAQGVEGTGRGIYKPCGFNRDLAF
jgi:hypothetical protein